MIRGMEGLTYKRKLKGLDLFKHREKEELLKLKDNVGTETNGYKLNE